MTAGVYRETGHFAALASFAAGIALPVAGVIGLDFFPSGDQSELDLTLTMPPSTTLDATNAVSQKMELELRQYPEVRRMKSMENSW